MPNQVMINYQEKQKNYDAHAVTRLMLTLAYYPEKHDHCQKHITNLFTYVYYSFILIYAISIALTWGSPISRRDPTCIYVSVHSDCYTE